MRSVYSNLMGLVLMTAASCPAVSYYVATNGNNSAAGTIGAPWQTIQKAASTMVAGDTCLVRAGTYRETVTPANSGTAANPITYQAYSNEVVTISGADPVTNWTVYSGSIYVANMASNWFSRATPGGGTRLFDPTVGNESDLILCDSQLMPLASWPNSSPGCSNLLDITRPPKSRITAFVSKGTNAANWTLGVFEDTALPQLGDNGYVGSEIVLQPNDQAWSWTFSGYISASTNRTGGGTTLTLKSPSSSGKDDGQTTYAVNSRYWLWNKLQFLDTAGEWYHDKSAGKLYLWAPDGTSPEGRVEARKRRFAFDLSNRSYITVRGFKLVACSITTDNASGGDNIGFYHVDGQVDYDGVAPADGVVRIRYPWRGAGSVAASSNCTLEDLEVNYPSWYSDVSGHFFLQWGQSSGVVLSGQDHVIRRCAIRNSAGNGVTLLGRRHRVQDCLIENVACMPTDMAGVGTGQATVQEDHEIARNTIRNCGRSGITPRSLKCTVPTVSTNDWKARIHHNDVSNFGLQDWDCGAIYTAGSLGWTRIDHNWFHSAANDVDSRPGNGAYTVGGVYLDYSQNAVVHHNAVWDVEWGIHLQSTDTNGTSPGNFLCYNNTVIVKRTATSVTYGPFGFVENSSATHSGTVISNNLIACSQSLSGYKAIDDFPSSAKGKNVSTANGTGGYLSSLGLNLQGGTNYPDAFFPTASSSLLVNQAVPMGTLTRDGTAIPAYNDPVSGAAPEIGAYEYGLLPWTAGVGSSSFAGLVLDSTAWTVLFGNPNGTIDPGETIEEQVVLWNNSPDTQTNMAAWLSCNNPNVTMLVSNSAYSDLAANALGTNAVPFRYRLSKSLACGTVLTFTHAATANGQFYTNTFSRTIGQTVAGLATTNLVSSTNVPKAIPDLATILSTNTVTGLSDPIADVNVGVRLDHTFDADLTLTLIHPDGTAVTLASAVGGSIDNFGSTVGSVTNFTLFDDQGGTSIASGTAPFTNATGYVPQSLLSALNSKSANGAWRLQVQDSASGDTGTLLAWNLRLITQSQLCQSTLFNQAPIASNLTATVVAVTNFTLIASDPDADPLTFQTNTLPAHGVISGFNSATGAFTYTPDPAYSGPDGFTFTASDGYSSSAPATVSLAVTSSIPTTPTNLVWSVTGSTLNLSWPSNYLGWELQVQTNSLGTGLGTNWTVVPGSTATNRIDQPVDPANPAAFYRLHRP
jgi:subtilisin-like proprotein convertase family protein